MFAAQYPSVGYPTFFELHAPPSYADPLSDYLAQQRQRQRELALREVEAAERRRAVQAELEAATYRAALVAEVERRRRQAAYAAARDQHRRDQERRRLAEARRARQRQPVTHGAFPSQLLELVFQLNPDVNHLDHGRDVELSEFSADEEEDEPVVHLVPLGTPNDIALSAADSDDDSTVDSEGTSVEEDDSDLSDAESAASSSSAYRDSALSTLASLSSELASRRSTFVSPTSLTFSPSPSPADRAARSPTPPLAFGSANASFLGYEEALLSLLTRIDAVESHGDREVQQARKELVRDVERELRRLDEIRDRAWEEQSGSSSGESDADDEAMGDAEDDEDAVIEQDDEDEVNVVILPSDSSDSDSSPAPQLSSRRGAPVKVPFAAPSSTPRHTRFASPALSSSSSSSSFADNNDDAPLNAASDDTASRLLDAHKLADDFDEMSDDERERLEMEALRAADRESESEEEEALSSDEEGVWVYC